MHGVNSESERRPESLPTNAEAAIHDRALRFASTLAFVNPKIARSAAAHEEDVAKYGTPGSTVYGEIQIHMDWGPGQRDMIASAKLEERAAVQDFLKSGVDLLVVCSSTDVIRHEFLGMDLG
jgi:hypothetical protein